MNTTDLERRILNLATGKLSYYESGSGPALLFLHGMNGSCRSWLKQFEFFSSHFRVIAWDAPGYGLSNPIDPTAEAYANAALAAATALDVERMVVIGHSMGGIIAAKIAHMDRARVSGLVLSSSYVGRGLPEGTPLQERYTRRINELTELPKDEYVSRRAKAVLPEGTNEKVVNFVKNIAAEMRTEGLIGAAKMAQYANNQSFLPQITVPTLVTTAALDRVLPYKFSLPFIESIPKVTHVSIEGVGHAAYVENDKVYNTILLKFFRDITN